MTLKLKKLYEMGPMKKNIYSLSFLIEIPKYIQYKIFEIILSFRQQRSLEGKDLRIGKETIIMTQKIIELMVVPTYCY